MKTTKRLYGTNWATVADNWLDDDNGGDCDYEDDINDNSKHRSTWYIVCK